jgi:hypothetical protein
MAASGAAASAQRGAKLPGTSAYITGYTPFTDTIRFEFAG